MESIELNELEERLGQEADLDRMAAENLAKADNEGFNLRVNSEEVCFPKYEDAEREFENCGIKEIVGKHAERFINFVQVLLEAYKYAEKFYTQSHAYNAKLTERRLKDNEDRFRQSAKMEKLLNSLVGLVDLTHIAKLGLKIEDIQAEFTRLCEFNDEMARIGKDPAISPDQLVSVGQQLNRLRGLPDDTPIAIGSASTDAGNSETENNVDNGTQES